MRWRSGRLPTTGAWLLVAAVATGAGAWPDPVWLKTVLLISAAAALRLALTGIWGIWPKMRSTRSSAPVPGAAAARHLSLGIRALTYRLERIHQLTGSNPADPQHRYTLQTAVIGARLLTWPANQL